MVTTTNMENSTTTGLSLTTANTATPTTSSSSATANPAIIQTMEGRPSTNSAMAAAPSTGTTDSSLTTADTATPAKSSSNATVTGFVSDSGDVRFSQIVCHNQDTYLC